ncbi:unnamed protein product [Medioppia subpectinata]|uniref:ADAMTS/ADAMTS-like cysteine-rich domain-containing protein n=1 Tax=Medioppia subpectinata TaxID=1979941 RepID=A0A7R9Q437_9ACAR|nr:unnamed protein product [Medioppia subpectinata]CAG2111044.1 unnamed protein product [Medioppia subpectinata]
MVGLNGVNGRSVLEDGWSEWSEWSICSRSCDGGVSVSLRKCNHKRGCIEGTAERHKICNMQPCPSDVDFRGTQCSNYNKQPYRGRLYEWLPYLDPLDPCSLTCRAKTFNFVAKHSPKAEDGTRCRDGSLDMCVTGKCLSVGCDLVLGSDNKVDGCGICGGDGTSCSRPTYIWSETNYSPCSVSCGRGYQMSQPICINNETKEVVDEILCDPTLRPRPHINECNAQKCPPL